MSNFYLDIIKDRLYCEPTDSVARRAAQTTIYRILRAMTLLVAPILSFTAEEIWGFMPHGAADDTESVFLNQMPEKSGLTADDAFVAKWDLIYQTRLDVNKVLEEKRNEKVIGKSLEAAVEIAVADETAYAVLSENRELLEKVLIVSAVTVTKTDAAETVYTVTPATGEKCDRCWMYSTTVGKNAAHPTLCARCASVISQ
jgi:isoleucyl-tRNA synthetase